MRKLKQKKCKNCGVKFLPLRPLAYVCSVNCSIEYAKKLKEKKQQKEWNEKKKELKTKLYPEKDKSTLQREINKLSRLIDALYYSTCIDCSKTYGKQVDGAQSDRDWETLSF